MMKADGNSKDLLAKKELLAAFEDMWVLGIHPQPACQPVTDLLHIMGRNDLVDEVTHLLRTWLCFLDSEVIFMLAFWGDVGG